jgi:hypothetical protein
MRFERSACLQFQIPASGFFNRELNLCRCIHRIRLFVLDVDLAVRPGDLIFVAIDPLEGCRVPLREVFKVTLMHDRSDLRGRQLVDFGMLHSRQGSAN